MEICNSIFRDKQLLIPLGKTLTLDIIGQSLYSLACSSQPSWEPPGYILKMSPICGGQGEAKERGRPLQTGRR